MIVHLLFPLMYSSLIETVELFLFFPKSLSESELTTKGIPDTQLLILKKLLLYL